MAVSVQAINLNEWTFESDAANLPLSGTLNCGSSSPLAQFGSGFGSTVFTASRGLICIGTDTGEDGTWTNGAILNAGFTNSGVANFSGVYYVRYDVAYNLNPSTNNNSGMVFGVYFTGETDDKAAGLVLGYDTGNVLASRKPANRRITTLMAGLPVSGALTAIAEVNTNSPATLKVWYGLGSTPTNYSTPSFATNITLSAVTNLRFHATGDFRPTTSDLANKATVDNIRMSDNWTDISAPIPNFANGPKIEISRIIITTPKGTFTNSSKQVVTALGADNTVRVVVRSLGSLATNITSTVAFTNAATAPTNFSIISNSLPPSSSGPLLYPQDVTNTFSVIISNNTPTDATYVLNMSAGAKDAATVFTNVTLTVGAQIMYLANSGTVISTSGRLPDKYEPGEIIELTVISTNAGTRAINNITNSLSADPTNFTITNTNPPSQNYPLLAMGATTSTTYLVEIPTNTQHGTYLFSVTNKAGTLVWSDTFPFEVFRRAVPSNSPSSITINLVKGMATTNREVSVTNSGNNPLTFYITDDGGWSTFYNVTNEALGTGFVAGRDTVVLNPPTNSYSWNSSTNAGVSSVSGIGFDFPFYGTVYSNFYVTADGYIGLSNTTNAQPAVSIDRTGPLPAAATVQLPLIAPFWGSLLSPASSIKTTRSPNNYFVISYYGVSKIDGETDLQFQVALFTNGCIEFRYKNIAAITNSYGTTNVTIGLQGSKASYTNLAVKPANGTLVRMTPQLDQWVSYPTQLIGVDQLESVGITFKVDATKKTVAVSKTFAAWFNWDIGGSNAVIVTVNVNNFSNPVYSAVSALSFTGAAGRVTSAQFIITNAGGYPLTFFIRDPVAAEAGYTTNNSGWVTQTNVVITTNFLGDISTNLVPITNSLVYNWIDISTTGTDITGLLMDPNLANPYITQEDEGFSAMIPLEEIMPFYGGGYTQVCVSVNGALRFDKAGRIAVDDLAAVTSSVPDQIVAPYWGDLVLDENATIKYLSTEDQMVVTWENVRQYGLGGGSNLTFQAILAWNGDITFQYKRLEGGLQWPNTTIGLRDTALRTKQVDIRQPGDWTLTNLPYSGRVYTQYVDVVSNRAVQFQFANTHVIGHTPNIGSIAGGSNAVITITGDASRQSDGSGIITNNTTLSIIHNKQEGLTNTTTETLAVTFKVTNSFESVFVPRRAAAGDNDGDGILDDQERIAGTDPQDAGSVFTPTIEKTATGIFLSWPAPLDGAPRTYTIYFTTNLMNGDSWNVLATVTSGTTYSDTEHNSEPVIYYKVTVQ
ncbi:MAG: NEW3 domain-containing protein [Kiritimatiellales bacterium]